MKVILKEDIFKLGSLGDEVEVKRGYARNYLIPQGKALPITRANVKRINHHKIILAKQRLGEIERYKLVMQEIEKAELVFKMKSSESGKLFGSVTTKNLHEALLKQEIEIDRKKLVLPAPIKLLGNYEVPVKLHTEVTASLKVQVIAEEGPSEKTETPDASEAQEAQEAPKAAEEVFEGEL